MDPSFLTLGTNLPSGTPTNKQVLEVHMIRRDANFRQMFAFGGVSLKELCLSQGQIRNFTKEHQDKLHPNKDATFFLFYVGGDDALFDEEKLFVADIRAFSDGPEVDGYRFVCDIVWRDYDTNRMVIPQLS